jgi:hypothetical protein
VAAAAGQSKAAAVARPPKGPDDARLSTQHPRPCRKRRGPPLGDLRSAPPAWLSRMAVASVTGAGAPAARLNHPGGISGGPQACPWLCGVGKLDSSCDGGGLAGLELDWAEHP